MSTARVDVQAWQDIDELMDYLIVVRKNRPAARRLFEEFDRVSQIHARQPTMGDPRPDHGPGLRSFLFRTRYVAVDRPLPDGIDVPRVFDATSDYAPRFRS